MLVLLLLPRLIWMFTPPTLSIDGDAAGLLHGIVSVVSRQTSVPAARPCITGLSTLLAALAMRSPVWTALTTGCWP